MSAPHPQDVLQDTGGVADLLPACEHYAGSERKVLKALAIQDSRNDFDLTLDLEDGAAVGQESELVRSFVEFVNRHQSGRLDRGLALARIGFRVHPPDHPAYADDLASLAGGLDHGLAYLTIPKLGGLAQAVSALKQAERAFAFAPKGLPPIQLLIETHGALHEVFGLAALPQVQSLAFGQMDFTSAHRGAIPASAMRSPAQFEHPLMRRAKLEISAACHAMGKLPVHNPTTAHQDPGQAHLDALSARELGFQRMWSIHPDQITPILSAFEIETAELRRASALLLAAQSADWGPISFEGELQDRASYRYYWSLLQRAHAQHQEIPAEARLAFFSRNSD